MVNAEVRQSKKAGPRRKGMILNFKYVDGGSFVTQSPSQAVGGSSATGDGRAQDDNTIYFWGTGILILERRASRKSGNIISEKADIRC